jgi:redox-sensing transcriptional repressor
MQSNIQAPIKPVPKPVLERLPQYLNYLKSRFSEPGARISAAAIARDLGLHPVQVRKDLAYISGGKPRTGFSVSELIAGIERYFGTGNVKSAVIVGAGHLGQALLSYDGFGEYGLDIKAAFDANPEKVGTLIHGKPVYSMDCFAEKIGELNTRIGIITVPSHAAQAVCDRMVAVGISAIWNFAHAYVEVPEHVILQNENMATSLALLSNKLSMLDAGH